MYVWIKYYLYIYYRIGILFDLCKCDTLNIAEPKQSQCMSPPSSTIGYIILRDSVRLITFFFRTDNLFFCLNKVHVLLVKSRSFDRLKERCYKYDKERSNKRDERHSSIFPPKLNKIRRHLSSIFNDNTWFFCEIEEWKFIVCSLVISKICKIRW